MLSNLVCISTLYLAFVHTYLLDDSAATVANKPLKILAINDMHLDMNFSDDNMYIH